MQANRKRLVAFVMWVWRRMEKISSIYKVTNEEVLQRVWVVEVLLIQSNSKSTDARTALRHQFLPQNIMEGSTVAPLQRRAQNAVARLIARLSPRDHVTRTLRELHWFPVPYWN